MISHRGIVTTVQTLPPRQTATRVPCDVLGFSTAEVSAMLDVAATTVKGLLQRARAAWPSAVPALTATAEVRLAQEFADAFEADNVEGVVALLTDEACPAMPPATEQYDGPQAIATFLRASALGRPGDGYTLLPTRAGGHPAFGCYLETRARGLIVLIPNLEGTAVSGIARFFDDGLHRRFDLPDAIGSLTSKSGGRAPGLGVELGGRGQQHEPIEADEHADPAGDPWARPGGRATATRARPQRMPPR